MNKNVWHVLKQPHFHHHIKATDYCLCKREYVSGYGYKGGPTNQLILNFKKPPLKQKTFEWKYRKQAVIRFKKEIESLFKPDLKISITAIPSSKHRSDPKYDRRFEDLFQELLKSRPSLKVEWPIEVIKTLPSSHQEGRRDPEPIKRNYTWKGFSQKSPPKRLCVFDDVLTTGAHFRAVSDFLRENDYEGQIIGVFWSRAILSKKDDIQ